MREPAANLGKGCYTMKNILMLPAKLLALIFGVALILLLVRAILMSFSPAPPAKITNTMYWGNPTEVTINVTWMSSDVSRTAEESDMVPETLTFAKAYVTTRLDSVELVRFSLLLTNDEEITLHTLHQSFFSQTVENGDQYAVDLQGWVPSALIDDITELGGRLAYTIGDP